MERELPPPRGLQGRARPLQHSSESRAIGFVGAHSTQRAQEGQTVRGARQKLNELGFVWDPQVHQGTPSWDERLDELTKYKSEHGHCKVPQSQGSLGRWADKQRAKRKRGKLSEGRVKKLEGLGFSWGTTRSTRPNLAPWEERLGELVQYKAEHGHCNVPQKQGSLGEWVERQRTSRRKGKLAEERVQKLDALGFDWSPRGPRGTQLTWDECLNKLTKYKAEHGHCNVPQKQGSLGNWVREQRRTHKKGKLSEERVQKLDALGFVWDPLSTQPTWDERLGELMNFNAKHGHCNVPQGQKPLGTWVDNQRTAYKKGKLSGERVQKLDALGFVWNSVPSWDERLGELTKYKVEHGHCNVPTTQGPLGTWVSHQRAVHKKGKLSEGRVQKLEGLGFSWSTTRSTQPSLAPWKQRLDELTKYKSEHGHCNVPTSQRPLGRWVQSQREAYKKNKLSKERVQKLNKLGFDWSPQGTPRSWDELFDELTKYKAEHGHCNVPRSHESLGTWVNRQRQAYKKGKLPEGRVQKLNEHGFVWNPTPSWGERLDELTKYKAEHGHCNVPASQGSLGRWVATQRQAYKKGKQSEELILKLDDLGFSWDRATRTAAGKDRV